MYLLYNLLQLQRISLNKVLYVKRQAYQTLLQDIKTLFVNDLKKITKQIRKHLFIENSIILRF